MASLTGTTRMCDAPMATTARAARAPNNANISEEVARFSFKQMRQECMKFRNCELADWILIQSTGICIDMHIMMYPSEHAAMATTSAV